MLDKEIRESVLKGTGGSPGGKLDELPQGKRTSDEVRESEDTWGAENSVTVFFFFYPRRDWD